MASSGRLVLVFCFFVLFMSSVQAAGLLSVCSGNYPCSSEDKIFPRAHSDDAFINFFYKTDLGSLGSFSNSEATAGVEDVIAILNNTPHSRIRFIKKDSGKLSSDINGDNFQVVLEPSEPHGYSPIVFDNDGSIVDSIFGEGAKNSVLGYADMIFVDAASETILESQAVINGHLFNTVNRFKTKSSLLDEFKLTTSHEFLHMIGIDHSQVHLKEYTDHLSSSFFIINGDDSNLEIIPSMFPVAAKSSLGLLRDDIASIAGAYPDNNFAQAFGTIRGFLRNPSPLTGGNIVAYNVNNPQSEVIASASDLFANNNGEFLLQGLVPGSYILGIEPIYRDFEGPSGVGPHPPPENPDLFPQGFYNGPGKPLAEYKNLNNALSRAFRINLDAGESINGLEINPITFKINSRRLRRAKKLRNDKTRAYPLKVAKTTSLPISVKFSSDRPELVSFAPAVHQFSSAKRRARSARKTIFINLSSREAFKAAFPEMSRANPVEIKISAQDQSTGFEHSQESLFVY